MVFEACEQLFSGELAGEAAKEALAQCPFASNLAGGMIGGTIMALGFAMIGLVLLALYVYTSLAWYTTAKKLKYTNAWLAWIPIIRIALVLQLGGFHWAWIFLLLIPVLGWIALFVILIIAKWRIFEKRKYPGWFSLAVIVPRIGGILYLIAIGFLAWGKGIKKK